MISPGPGVHTRKPSWPPVRTARLFPTTSASPAVMRRRNGELADPIAGRIPAVPDRRSAQPSSPIRYARLMPASTARNELTLAIHPPVGRFP
ncbi:hypothetical protein UK23_36715, partial [Lentzea aerocolonigenes]